jgi:hypothetical protein
VLLTTLGFREPSGLISLADAMILSPVLARLIGLWFSLLSMGISAVIGGTFAESIGKDPCLPNVLMNRGLVGDRCLSLKIAPFIGARASGLRFLTLSFAFGLSCWCSTLCFGFSDGDRLIGSRLPKDASGGGVYPEWKMSRLSESSDDSSVVGLDRSSIFGIGIPLARAISSAK